MFDGVLSIRVVLVTELYDGILCRWRITPNIATGDLIALAIGHDVRIVADTSVYVSVLIGIVEALLV